MSAPSGTVTFLFTDIEGSTRLWDEHPETMRTALARHDVLLREAIEGAGGFVFKTVGDAFCAAFAEPAKAAAAALAIQGRLKVEPWPEQTPLRVRVALHTGEAALENGDYFGRPLNRVARILSAAHGGQTLLSESSQSLLKEATPPNAGVRDLGRHLLRDLMEPENLFELYAGDTPPEFPALRTLGNWPNNLPAQLTTFVGREEEIVQIEDLLGQHRLVTLCGTAGLGKTRLALQASAQGTQAFPDGGWLIELGTLRDPVEVPAALQRVLGLKEARGETDTSQRLVDHLKDRRALLLFDNAEHLLEPVRALLRPLLRGCAKVRVLATSREPIGVEGECVLRIPPLPVPKNGTLDGSPALRLFLERAALARPGLRPDDLDAAEVGEICRRLDGVPLALELAAARLRVMEPRQIRERLDQMFRVLDSGSRGQRSLHAALEWSHESLEEPARVLFRRLAAFGSAWSLEDAEAVGGFAPLEAYEVLELLADLVDRSLCVRVEHDRYRFLEPVRQFAMEMLVASEEHALMQKRHLERFASRTQALSKLILGGSAKAASEEMDSNHAECLTAMRAALSNPELVPLGLQIAADSAKFWAQRGYVSVGQRLLESLLAASGEKDTRDRARAFGSLGVCNWYGGRLEEALEANGKGLEIAVRLNLTDTRSSMLDNSATLLFGLGRKAEARTIAEQALAFDREHGFTIGAAAMGGLLGQLLMVDEEFDEACERFRESADAFRGDGNMHGWAVMTNNLGETQRRRGDLAAARTAFTDCAAYRHSIKDQQGVIWSLEAFARLRFDEGDAVDSMRLLACAEAHRRSTGFNRMTSDEAAAGTLRAAALEAIGEAAVADAEACGGAQDPDRELETLIAGIPTSLSSP